MSFNLTIKSLEFWLRQKEYSIPKIVMTKEEISQEDYKMMERNNRILGRSFGDTFSIWFSKWGRIPTPQEFIAMQLKDVKKNYSVPAWKRNYHVKFKWTPAVEKGIKQRILRSYISFINELHTELMIKQLYPKVKISRNTELDFAGIDILAKDLKSGVTHKIHITKNSPYAIEFLFKKEGKKLNFKQVEGKVWGRPNWGKVNHAIYKDRDFKGHVFLLYDSYPSYSTRVVNGYSLFTQAYVKNRLDVNIKLKTGA